jgi:hypothetical protein
MIITQKIKILNSSYYKNKGFISDINGFIEIEIKDLTTGSNHIILAKCDFCEKEKEVSYKKYNQNIINNNLFSCSKLCGRNKAKITNLEKYGVDNPSKIKKVREKAEKTNLEKYGFKQASQNNNIKNETKNYFLEKYGVDNPMKLENIKEKIKETNLEKYGVDNPMKLEKIKEKIKKTNLERYGVNSFSKTNEFLEKNKLTNLERYGVEYPLQNKEIHNKFKKTNLERYGVEYPLQSEESLQKEKQTNLDKYGVQIYSKSEQSRKNFMIANHLNYIKYINDGISLFKCDCKKEHDFEIHKDNFYKRIQYKIPLCTICYPIGDQKSIKEKILLEYIQSIYNGEIISGYRDGIEIDIYLPELKTGIEFNGLYWHSDKFKESNYHLNKQIYFKGKGIDIKFIYEDDFDNNLDIIKSQICNWLNLTQVKIYARKTEVKKVNIEEYKNFLDANHIQGYIASKLVYGLYNQNQLVSLMCFDKKEGRINMKEGEWNLNRFCNLLNNQVIGGASKLLNYFIKENNPSRIISYADKDWSSGNLYNVLGLNLINESRPDYKYIVNGIRKSKQNFTKTKLAKLGYDTLNLTESQIMNNLGINRIYDCGKMKFEFLNLARPLI